MGGAHQHQEMALCAGDTGECCGAFKPQYWNHVAGVLYGISFWLWVDGIVAGHNGKDYTVSGQGEFGNITVTLNQKADAISNPGYYIPFITCTIFMILLNTVPHDKISGKDESAVCAARTLVTGTFIVLFAGIAISIWITAHHNGDDDHHQWWPFIANILSVTFLTIS